MKTIIEEVYRCYKDEWGHVQLSAAFLKIPEDVDRQVTDEISRPISSKIGNLDTPGTTFASPLVEAIFDATCSHLP